MHHLGCAVGTVKSRLPAAKKAMGGSSVGAQRQRLRLRPHPPAAGVERLCQQVKMTVVYATAASRRSHIVAAITEGVLRAMFLSKLKLVMTATAVLAALAAGAVALAQSGDGKS